MFSFMKIATYAALAFGTLASAIPTPAPVPEAAALEERSGKTITAILTGLHSDLQHSCGAMCTFAVALFAVGTLAHSMYS